MHVEALSRSQGANVMSFAYSSGQVASVLVSKNGGRYRLQSDCFQSMWLVVQVGTAEKNIYCELLEHSAKSEVAVRGVISRVWLTCMKQCGACLPVGPAHQDATKVKRHNSW
jgi:hypothetical protein